MCMKFIAPSRRRCVFTLQLKGKDSATGLKAVSSWLKTPEIRRGRCSLLLPPPSSLPFKRSDNHGNPQRPSVPVQYPALAAAAQPQTHTQRNIKRLIHTNVLSAGSVRWRSPLHPRIRRWKTSERKTGRKKEVTKFNVKTSVFRN